MDVEKIIITSKRHGIYKNIKRLYEFRRLIFIFAKRDIKVQYAQTFLGLLSSVLQPLTALVVFTFFFDILLDITHRFGINVPYPLFAFTGMIPLVFFYYAYRQCGNIFITVRTSHQKNIFSKTRSSFVKSARGIGRILCFISFPNRPDDYLSLYSIS